MRFARRCSTITVQLSEGMRAATPRLLRLSASMYSSDTGVSSGRAGGCDERRAAHIRRLGDQRFLVRIAVGDQLAVRRDHHGVAAGADADGPPSATFPRAEFTDQPADGSLRCVVEAKVVVGRGPRRRESATS